VDAGEHRRAAVHETPGARPVGGPVDAPGPADGNPRARREERDVRRRVGAAALGDGDRGLPRPGASPVGGPQHGSILEHEETVLVGGEVEGRDLGCTAQVGRRPRQACERQSTVIAAAQGTLAADDERVAVDQADALQRDRQSGRRAAPRRATVLGGEERSEPAGGVAPRAFELQRLDGLALRARVAPLPARVPDAHGSGCARRGDRQGNERERESQQATGHVGRLKLATSAEVSATCKKP
jgi:hypothetical protein